MQSHQVVSQEEWLVARKELLIKEKEFTQLRDQLNTERRSLPWVKVDKDYNFDGAEGQLNLEDLFNDKSQLMVYHFMLGPDWEEGCPSCSFWADNFDGIDIHIAAYKKRMGWRFKWVSSINTDFNYDFGVSFTAEEKAANEITYNYLQQPYFIDELAGVSVFIKDNEGNIFHTYSTYSRGIDLLNGAYNYIDLTPKGRDEGEGIMKWLRRHDQY